MALRAGDAHSHEDEECRKRLRFFTFTGEKTDKTY